MASITRGTTPQVTCNVAGIDLTQFACYVSIGSNNHPKVTISGEAITTTYDGTDSQLTFTMTQAQTLALHEGATNIQLRAAKDGHAVASGEVKCDILPVILDGEIDG